MTRRKSRYNRQVKKHATEFGMAVISVYAPHTAAIITAYDKGRRLLKDFS